MVLLKIKKLVKYYRISKNNKFKALDDINLEFEKGEIISILGESGSGKSTLMNILGGLDTDYDGEVLFEGKNLRKLTEKELDKYRKNKIGFVFQSFNLISHLTVLDNVTIAMTLSNISKNKRIKRAKEILKDLGLKDQINKRPNQLSGGQKQRVAIARALINDPDIILADEPTGALDSQTSVQILDILREISKKGKTIIMVTHSQLVASISSRVVTISDGQIVSDEKRINELDNNEKVPKINKEKQNLSFMSAVYLALNNMKQKLTRNLLVAIGASIGIMSVIIMLALGEGIKTYVTDIMNENVNPKVLEVNKKIEFDENYQPLDNQVKYFLNDEIEELKSIKNVEKVELAFSKMESGTIAFIQENSFNIQSVNTFSSNLMEKDIVSGKFPKKNEILISNSFYEKIKGKINNVIGKTLELQILENEKLIKGEYKISGVYENNFQMNQIFLNYDDLKILYDTEKIEFEPNSLLLILDDETSFDIVKEKVVEMGYSSSIQEQLLEVFNEMLDVLTYVLAGIAAISLFVSAIMILVVLYISVVERTNEIGVLKAIGARRKDIKRIFVSEAFLLGLFSGIIGIISAFVLQTVANYYTNQLYEVNVSKITFEFMLFGLITSILISVISGLWPASRAAKLDPIESLRHE